MADDGAADHDDREGGGWWSLLLPTLTFVVGLALGGGLVYATSGGDAATTPEAAPAAPPSPSVAEGGDTTVTLPAECEQASQRLTEAYGLLREAVGQVRDFDAGRLVETIDELQTVDEQTRPLVEACSQVSVGTAPSGSAEPSPEG